MPNFGMGELVVILLILMLVFGASRLPQLGEGLGKAIRGLKRGLNTDDDIDVTPKDKEAEGSAKAIDDGAKDPSKIDVKDLEKKH